jgi:uncharacterized protein (TIGR03437 family)
VGVPYSFSFESFADVIADLQQEGVDLTITYAVTAGSLPPGLTLSSEAISGTPITAGAYNFTVTLRLVVTYMGETLLDLSNPMPSSLRVAGFSGPSLTIDPGGLSFPLAQSSTAVVSQPILITNRGAQAQTATVSTSTNSGSSAWLSASGASVAPFSSGAVQVSVNPSGLAPGTYTGAVSIALSPAGQITSVSVVATVSGGNQQIALSGSGLRFQTVAGGGTPLSQSISVLSSGTGSLNFSVSTSTLSGGPGWLSVSPSSGAANSSSSTSISVSIRPAGLAPGDYYGQVQVSAPGVDNSPQSASVVLNVAPADASLGGFVSPTGLIFVGPAGGANPASKTVTVTNPSNVPLTFTASVSLQTGKNLFTLKPASGSVSAASPVPFTVQPVVSGLAAGIYRGTLSFYFSDNSTRRVALLLIVLPGGSGTEPQPAEVTPRAAGCTPAKLLPVFTQLGESFTTVAAWPTPIEVTIVDDCGTPMTAGTVVASFSSGDPPLSLLSLRDGRWSATWQPRFSTTQPTITARAQQSAPPLQGTETIGGKLQSNPTTPSISAGGAVSAASGGKYQPLAPGSLVSIYGSHLSSGPNQAPDPPLPAQLGPTQAILGGRLLPLLNADDGLVNAIIPYDVPPNTTQQLIVINGTAYSVPEPVVIALAQPAVFVQPDGTGMVFDVQPDDSRLLIDSSHPASADDVVVIYCAGLGPVDPPVVAGDAAPSSPQAATTNLVTVSIDGQDAVVQFAGLVPGMAGLYEVDVVVPTGITPADNVPLVVTVAGQQSTPVTIAVQ